MLNESEIKLLKALIQDEKKQQKNLYSAGSYWKAKNSKTILELKKKGLDNFRGIKSGVSTSFSDNLVYDVRNEFNISGRIVGNLIYKFPFVRKIFDAQLKLTSNYINRHLKSLSLLYPNNNKVIGLIEKYQFDQTVNFGSVQNFTYNKKQYSTHYLQMAYRIEQLSNYFDFNKINSLLEIGGGFGSNIHFLLSNFKNIKKVVYLDIVPNIFVGTQYLKSIFKDNVKDYLYFRDKNQIKFENNDKLEIYCLPSWEIQKLTCKVDHFHNASSFVEMPQDVIKNYVSFIKKLEIKEISLISYGQPNLKTTFEPENLNLFFDNSLQIKWTKGLIENFDRELIFLVNK